MIFKSINTFYLFKKTRKVEAKPVESRSLAYCANLETKNEFYEICANTELWAANWK